MSEYKANLQASEEIRNYTVCVIDNGKIRNMKNYTDLYDNLVYVNNIMPIGKENDTIKTGEYVRYIYISVVERLSR